MYIFGGSSETAYLNDLFKFNFGKIAMIFLNWYYLFNLLIYRLIIIVSFCRLDTKMWTQLQENIPNPKRKDESKDNNNTTSNTRTEIAGKVPSPRSFAAGITYQGNIYVFGGNSQKGYKNSLYKYQVEKNQWAKIIPTKGIQSE